jgi:chromosome segregation ATPase
VDLLTLQSSLVALDAQACELRELGEKHIESLENRNDLLASELQSLRQRAEQDRTALVERIRALEGGREEANQDVGRFRRELEAERQSHAAGLGDWNEQRLSLIAAQQMVESRCEQLEHQLATQAEGMRQHAVERDEARQETERQRQEAERLRLDLAVERATRELERENWRGEAERLSRERDDACRHREELETRHAEAGHALERQRQEAERLRLDAEQLRLELERLQMELDGAQQALDSERAAWLKERDEISVKQEESHRRQKSLEADCDQLGQEVNEQRQELAKLRRDNEQLHQEMAVPPPAPLTSAVNHPPALPDEEGSVTELRDLEQQLRRQCEHADLLQLQMEELQDQLEHYFLLARDHCSDPIGPTLTASVPSPLLIPDIAGPETATINQNRARLLSAP